MAKRKITKGMEKFAGIKKPIKKEKKSLINDNKIISLEFDNPLKNPNSYDLMEQKEDNLELPDNEISTFTPLDVLETPSLNPYLPSVKNQPKKSSGSLGKKIIGVFKKKKPVISDSTNLSFQDHRGDKKPSEMSEMELLEHDFKIKKELLKKKQEEELQERIKKQEEFIRQQKQLQEKEKKAILKQPKKTYENDFIPENLEEIKLVSSNLEILNYCSKCGKKYKKGKIIRQGNTLIQEIKCKKCNDIFEKRIEI